MLNTISGSRLTATMLARAINAEMRACVRGSGDLAVAIVPAKVLEAVADFAERHGFAPS